MVGTNAQKLIENEAKFREFNESIENGFDDLRKRAEEQDWDGDFANPSGPVFFYCECSDENCRLRVKLPMKDYDTIHKDRNKFVVLRGHEVLAVESVVECGDEYCIVEKSITPPEEVDHFHKTDVHNV